MEWSALVSDIAGSTAVVIANADDGSRLDYVFDSEIGFFQSFSWIDASGASNLRMMLSDSGSGHTGDVYFVRGGTSSAKHGKTRAMTLSLGIPFSSTTILVTATGMR